MKVPGTIPSCRTVAIWIAGARIVNVMESISHMAVHGRVRPRAPARTIVVAAAALFRLADHEGGAQAVGHVGKSSGAVVAEHPRR